MNRTETILIIGFIAIGIILWQGLDKISKNQAASDFEVCLDSLDGQTWNEYNDQVAKTMLCAGTK